MAHAHTESGVHWARCMRSWAGREPVSMHAWALQKKTPSMQPLKLFRCGGCLGLAPKSPLGCFGGVGRRGVSPLPSTSVCAPLASCYARGRWRCGTSPPTPRPHRLPVPTVFPLPTYVLVPNASPLLPHAAGWPHQLQAPHGVLAPS